MTRVSRVGFGFLLASGMVFWFGNPASAEFNIREKRLEHAAGHVPGEILVTFKPGVSEAAKAAVHARHGGRRLRVGYGNAFEVVAGVAGNEEALAQAYVSYVGPLKRVSSLLVAMVGGRLFGEPDLGRRAGACLVMVVGAVLVVT